MNLADWLVALVLASLVVLVWTAIIWNIIERLHSKPNGNEHDDS